MTALKPRKVPPAARMKRPAARTATVPKGSALSTEYVDDSVSEIESGNGGGTTTWRSTDISATPTNKDVLLARPTTTTKGTTPLAPKSKLDANRSLGVEASQTSSSSASGDDSDGSGESGNESEGKSSGIVARQQTKESAPSPLEITQLQPLYTPPPGFEPGSISLSSFAAPDIMSPSNLEGKQIWHITVPASVPVDSIKEVSMQSVQRGDLVLIYKGADYGFVADGESLKVPKRLLIPDQGNNNYRAAAMAISQTLHLQQRVNLPNIGTASAVSADSEYTTAGLSRGFIKAVRPQPKGMKMRYLPLGDNEGRLGRMGPGSSTSGGSDDEEAHFRMPSGVSGSGKTKKRKYRAGDNPDEGHQSPEERRLKRSRSEANRPSEAHGSTETSRMEIDSQGDAVRERLTENSNEAIIAEGVRQKPKKRSGEDRAKRKEEKRRKKRAKANSVESTGGPVAVHNS